jgi:monooxygenase
VQRALDELPKQGTTKPWTSSMNYYDDVRALRRSPVVDKYLHFKKSAVTTKVIA